MKKILPLIIFLLVTEIVSAEPIIGFLQTLQNTSPKNSKTLLIFYKPDCPYCINMDKTISANANFTNQLTQKYNVQVLDITSPQGRLMADKFNIHTVPTIVNFDNATGESNIIKGFGSVEKLSKKLGLSLKNIVEEKKQTENNFGVCGDGVVDAGEQCDDGNVVNGDGCSAACTVQVGYTCVGSPSICSATCGDGIVAGAEQCDDGNVVNGDGCSATCTLETAPSNDECVNAIAITGNSGTVVGNNSLATLSAQTAPTCALSIKKDMWYSFNIIGTKKYRININGPGIADPVVALYSGSCGALVQVDCNDDYIGNYSGIVGTLSAGNYILRVGSFNVTVPGTFSVEYNLNLANICGDGILENNEECDDGNINNGDGCNSACKIENAASIVGVAINRDSVRANPSAMLDVKSFNKGILIPRMSSTQRSAITLPATGLLVFDITTNTFWFYNASVWTEIGGATGIAGGGLPAATASQTLRNNGTNWVANSALQNDGANITLTGQIKIAGGTPALGKVLTSDATGLSSWKDAAGSIAFFQQLTNSQVLLNSGATVRFLFSSGTNSFNTGNAFNTVTSEFVTPSAGLYSFTLDMSIDGTVPATVFSVISKIRVDNASNIQQQINDFRDIITPGVLSPSFSHTVMLKLNTGDKVYVSALKNTGGGVSNVTINGGGGTPSTIFMGYKIN